MWIELISEHKKRKHIVVFQFIAERTITTVQEVIQLISIYIFLHFPFFSKKKDFPKHKTGLMRFGVYKKQQAISLQLIKIVD